MIERELLFLVGVDDRRSKNFEYEAASLTRGALRFIGYVTVLFRSK